MIGNAYVMVIVKKTITLGMLKITIRNAQDDCVRIL